MTYLAPSDHARALVRGAYDLHVHINPDLIARRTSDIELAQSFARLGLAGFVLKSHYAPTAERAHTAHAAVPTIDVLGAIVLNHGVGGFNPIAVEIAGRAGARIVWLPTVDALNEAHEYAALPDGVALPLWARLKNEFAQQGLAGPSLSVLAPNGHLTPIVLQILRVVATHQMVLATGHLSRDEIMAVVAGAQGCGVRDIVVTHPDYPSQNLSIADQSMLAQQGIWLERCFAPSQTGKVPWDRLCAAIRATGVSHSVLSTDLGQPSNPPVEDGLALFADRLLDAGFSDEEIRTMAVTNTQRLARGEEIQ